jgi:hypothetical protein
LKQRGEQKKWGKWIRRNQLKVEIKRKDQIGSKLVMQWEEKTKEKRETNESGSS